MVEGKLACKVVNTSSTVGRPVKGVLPDLEDPPFSTVLSRLSAEETMLSKSGSSDLRALMISFVVCFTFLMIEHMEEKR